MALPDDEEMAAARLLWDYHRLDQLLRPCRVIVGLGSYDLRVADRCADLFQAGFADRVLFTGGSGNRTGGLYARSEAASFAERAVARGVPSDAILTEERAANLGENIRFAKDLIGAGTGPVLFVTKPQTMRRCRATVLKQWPDVEAVMAAPRTTFEEQPTDAYPLDMLINEMVGDLWRMIEYPKLGFQIEEEVPEGAREASIFLASHGYDRHRIK